LYLYRGRWQYAPAPSFLPIFLYSAVEPRLFVSVGFYSGIHKKLFQKAMLLQYQTFVNPE
jgi:hypothetical protein